VYGTVLSSANEQPTSSYTIDGGTTYNFTPGANPGPSSEFRTPFFRSPLLSSNTQHTLKVELQNNGSFAIDFLLVTPVSALPSLPSDSSTTTATGGTRFSPSPTGNSPSLAKDNHSSKAIAAGTAVGAIIVLLLIGIVWRLLPVQQRKRIKLGSRVTPWRDIGMYPCPQAIMRLTKTLASHTGMTPCLPSTHSDLVIGAVPSIPPGSSDDEQGLTAQMMRIPPPPYYTSQVTLEQQTRVLDPSSAAPSDERSTKILRLVDRYFGGTHSLRRDS
jgi:hypothetical protein